MLWHMEIVLGDGNPDSTLFLLVKPRKDEVKQGNPLWGRGKNIAGLFNGSGIKEMKSYHMW